MVKREHNKGGSKFRVDTNRQQRTQQFMKNVVCFLKGILMTFLLRNSVICILVLFKLLLNHSLEKV